MTIKSKKQSVNHKENIYVGSPPKPIYFAWINITDSIIMELWKLHSHLYKTKENIRFEKRNRIKTVHVKIGFLEFIWKLELWELNLKTGILGIKFKNWNFGNQIWNKLEFWKLEIKFESRKIRISEIGNWIWKSEFVWKIYFKMTF